MGSIASDVLGTFGAVFWSIQLLPQIWVNYSRPSHTKGLQPSMMLLWAAAGIPLGIYNILSHKSIALQVQPQILTFLSLVTWGQVYYYGHRWSFLKTSLVVALLCGFGAILELAGTLPFLLARSDESAPHAYLLAMAILSAIGLGLGVLRHYWDIYTHRSVRGISFFFVGLDAAGDLTSLLSVVIVKPVDIEGSAIYAVELALWIGIMWLGVVYNLREWVTKKRGFSGEENGEPTEEALGPGDHALTESSMAIERTTSNGSSASSVFQTVGLRKRATQLLRRSKVSTPP